MKINSRIKIYLLAAGIFLIAFSCFAEDKDVAPSISPERLFARGNDYYEKGEYDEAAGEYKKIIDRGYRSGPIYYNLAGAYFKSGRLGMAILNYERAKLFMPRSADLWANYRFAQAKIKGEIIPPKGIWAWRPVKMYSEFFTINELTWLCSIMYICILCIGVLTIIRPVMRRYRLVPVALLVIGIVFTSLVIWNKTVDMHSLAVTISPEAEALFGPFDSATRFFTLQEGMAARILKSKDEWYKVRRVDGKAGWVKKNALSRVK